MRYLSALFATLFLLSTATIFAQSDNTWTPHYVDDNVRIDYTYYDCNMPSKGTNIQYVYLKITNLTHESVAVDFDKWVWYNNKCNSCDGNMEHHKTISLKPNETLSGACVENPDRHLQIYSKRLSSQGKSVMTKFQLGNIKTTILD